jgi:large subunit ribosomal protein L22
MEKRKVKKSVLIRERKEAKAEIKEQMQGKLGEAAATLANIPTTPRKMRLIADMVRGRRVAEALNLLTFEAKVGAAKIKALLKSAIANWQNKNEDLDLEEADLYVKAIYVDGGRMLKRLRPAPQGRGHRIRKRSNHVTLVVDSLSKSDEFIQDVQVIKESKQD